MFGGRAHQGGHCQLDEVRAAKLLLEVDPEFHARNRLCASARKGETLSPRHRGRDLPVAALAGARLRRDFRADAVVRTWQFCLRVLAKITLTICFDTSFHGFAYDFAYGSEFVGVALFSISFRAVLGRREGPDVGIKLIGMHFSVYHGVSLNIVYVNAYVVKDLLGRGRRRVFDENRGNFDEALGQACRQAVRRRPQEFLRFLESENCLLLAPFGWAGDSFGGPARAAEVSSRSFPQASKDLSKPKNKGPCMTASESSSNNSISKSNVTISAIQPKEVPTAGSIVTQSFYVVDKKSRTALLTRLHNYGKKHIKSLFPYKSRTSHVCK